MIIEDSFEVEADPDRVFAFLLDVHNVAACVRGAQLTRVVDDKTYEGQIRMKVGPIVAAYSGTARIVEADADARRAVLRAEGKETRGSGTASATAQMLVAPSDTGSNVVLTTEFEVAGRLAQFGRGIMQDLSGKLVSDMAANVRKTLLATAPADNVPAHPPVGEPSSAPSTVGSGSVAEATPVGATPVESRAGSSKSAVPVLALLWAVIGGWFRRHFRIGGRR